MLATTTVVVGHTMPISPFGLGGHRAARKYNMGADPAPDWPIFGQSLLWCEWVGATSVTLPPTKVAVRS